MPRSRQPSQLPYGKPAAQPDSWRSAYEACSSCRRRPLISLPPCDGRPARTHGRTLRRRIISSWSRLNILPSCHAYRLSSVFRTKPYILSRLADRSFICGLVRKDEPVRARRTAVRARLTTSVALCGKTNPVRTGRTAPVALCGKTNLIRGTASAPVALCGKTNPARLTARKEPGARIGANRRGTLVQAGGVAIPCPGAVASAKLVNEPMCGGAR